MSLKGSGGIVYRYVSNKMIEIDILLVLVVTVSETIP